MQLLLPFSHTFVWCCGTAVEADILRNPVKTAGPARQVASIRCKALRLVKDELQGLERVLWPKGTERGFLSIMPAAFLRLTFTAVHVPGRILPLLIVREI